MALGKTTLFNVITGFYRPDAGSIVFEGKDITGMPPHEICREGIARTFQLTRPFGELSVFDNVLIGALLRRKNIDEAKELATGVLSEFGLLEKRDVLSKDLNVIERKQLEFARALATEPKLLLLDEVMAGLRPVEIERVLNIIRRVRKRGITIVVIEHVMKAIMGVADRIIVLNHGEKIAEGKPKEIQENEVVIKAYLGEEYVST